MEKKIMEVLMELGVPTGNKGYRYLIITIKKAIDNNGDVGLITKELYPDIAKAYQTTPQRVERAIRHAIDTVFTKSDVNAVYKYCGNYIGEKLSNRNFITVVAYQIMMNNREENSK